MKRKKIDPFNAIVILIVGALLFWAAIILGSSPLGFVFPSAGAATPTTYPLQVHLPEPGYRKADGSILNFTEFRSTKILYGTCDPTTGIGELYGEVSVKSWGFVSPTFRVPVNVEVCIIAVVIGLDDQPMGRSNVAKYLTAVAPGKPVPQTPRSLRIMEGT